MLFSPYSSPMEMPQVVRSMAQRRRSMEILYLMMESTLLELTLGKEIGGAIW